MPFALVLIGLILVITAARDTHREFGALIADDFTGQGNFFYWIVSILVIGSIGYYKPARAFSNSFLFLVALSMFIANRGFFAKLQEAIGGIQEFKPDEQGGTGGPLEVTLNGGRGLSMDDVASGGAALERFSEQSRQAAQSSYDGAASNFGRLIGIGTAIATGNPAAIAAGVAGLGQNDNARRNAQNLVSFGANPSFASFANLSPNSNAGQNFAGLAGAFNRVFGA
jgi:hypothetical protein